MRIYLIILVILLSFAAQSQEYCKYINHIADNKIERTDNLIGDAILSFRESKGLKTTSEQMMDIPRYPFYKLIMSMLKPIQDCLSDNQDYKSTGSPVKLQECDKLQILYGCLNKIEMNDERKDNLLKFFSGIEAHLISSSALNDTVIPYLKFVTSLASKEVVECKEKLNQVIYDVINPNFKKSNPLKFGMSTLDNQWTFSILQNICSDKNYKKIISCLKDISAGKHYHLGTFDNTAISEDNTAISEICKGYKESLSTEFRKCLRDNAPELTEKEMKTKEKKYNNAIDKLKEKHPNSWMNEMFKQNLVDPPPLIDMRKESEINSVNHCMEKVFLRTIPEVEEPQGEPQGESRAIIQ